MLIKTLCIVSAAIVAAAGIYLFVTSSSSTVESQFDPAQAAIRKLSSPDEAERQAGKAALIELGPQSVKPLMSLLRELIDDTSPRYMEGKANEVEEADSQVSSFTINWRLKSDVCQILGKIRCEEAISLLIDLMGSYDTSGSSEQTGPEMYALIDIGQPAVPRLIETIETAEQKIAATINVGPMFTEIEKQRMIAHDVFHLQTRAAMVLGGIGDDAALPALMKLQATTKNQILLRYLREAIEKIFQKNSQ